MYIACICTNAWSRIDFSLKWICTLKIFTFYDYVMSNQNMSLILKNLTIDSPSSPSIVKINPAAHESLPCDESNLKKKNLYFKLFS